MGNVASSPESDDRPHLDARRRDDGGPPMKRRRISTPESFTVDHLIAPPAPGASESGETLRVDVLKVLHKDSKKVRASLNPAAPRDSSSTTANCRITISDLGSSRPKVLFCQSQLCDITTFKNPVGPHRVARVVMPHPFSIPVESILVNKADGSFDLSDNYQLLVELTAANGSNWPPLDSSDFGSQYASAGPNRNCVLTTQCNHIFGKLRTPLNLTMGEYPHESTRQTDYVMDVDLRWAAGFKAHKGSMPCITAIDPDVEHAINDHVEAILEEGVNGVDGIHTDLHHDHDDELDGENTPSRSLRTREKRKVYNLKVLSDQAQGKEKKRRAIGYSAAAEGRINYLLPIDQPVSLDYHRCITCGAYHHSMLELQVHLKTVHPKYEYTLETTSQVPQFRVTRHFDMNTSPSKTYQLGRPAKPFNLETYIANDQSWLASRLGSEVVDEPPRSPTKSFLDRIQTGSPVTKAFKVAQRSAEKSTANKILVPETMQPLFHSVSKAPLKAGQEVPKITPDSSWLLQKHREAIGDFSDVTPAEKEYIIEWDGFILQENLTTAAYFPRAWLSFVQGHAEWLAAAEHRMQEFGKHTSVLLVRDVLNDNVIDEALALINEARASPQLKVKRQCESSDNLDVVDGALKQSPRASHIRRSANGCTVCELPVLGPRLLLCSNKACSHRLFHSDCIKATAVMSVDRPGWLCNTCRRNRESS